jgi:hypothetical protein
MIEGDALLVSVFNGTEWHVSEVTVALTVVKKAMVGDASVLPDTKSSGAVPVPVAASDPARESEARPEKRPDVTVIYRMRAAAAPSATTVFSAPLNLEIAVDDEWHWAIVQARGYPPQSYSGKAPQTAAGSGDGGEKQIPPFRSAERRNDNLYSQDSPVQLPQGSQ